jgi:hypothetical protein
VEVAVGAVELAVVVERVVRPLAVARAQAVLRQVVLLRLHPVLRPAGPRPRTK